MSARLLGDWLDTVIGAGSTLPTVGRVKKNATNKMAILIRNK
jgi:hypothetical protein